VIIGIIPLCERSTFVLFNLGYTFSCVSTYFAIVFDMIYDRMCVPFNVSPLVSVALLVDRVYRSCVVSFDGYDTWVDFIILGMVDFDIILCID